MSSQVHNHLTIHTLIAAQAARQPDAPALLAPGRPPLSFSGLAAHIERSVEQLNQLGIGRGDRVGIVLPNGPEAASLFLAVGSAAAAAPLNPHYRDSEFEFYLSDARCRALIILEGDQSLAGSVAGGMGIPVIRLAVGAGNPAGLFTLEGDPAGDAARPGLATPEDVALVLHTSGTTSRPKLVPLTQANLCASALSIRESLRLAPEDRCLNVMPLFHIHGLIGALLASLTAGASVACTPGFLAPHFFAWMEELHPTWYTAVPTMHQAILQQAATNRAMIEANPLRFIRSSSSALAPQVLHELESAFNAPVVEAYGMTEASHQMAINPLPPGVRKPGTVGRATGVEIAIMDGAGALLPVGSTGEVVIRGPSVTHGYENNPEANTQAFSDGWFRTGDQGMLDAEGYLTLTGRIKEIINRGGEKIAPREVDEALLSHPGVAQAVAFAVPDPRLGEDIGAAVVLRAGAQVGERTLRDFVAARLAEFKVPRRIVFVDEIPKGPTGKLQRIGLAERLGLTFYEDAAADGPAQYTAPATELEQRLAGIWAEVLRLERVGVQDRFADLGGDSILAMQIVARIREDLQADVTLRDFGDTPTVRSMARVIGALGTASSLDDMAIDLLRGPET